MSFDSDPSRLLTSNQNIPFYYFFCYILEADRGHFQFKPMLLRLLLQHAGCGKRFYHSAAIPFFLMKVLQQQTQNLVRTHKLPFLVDHGDSVCIAIVCNPRSQDFETTVWLSSCILLSTGSGAWPPKRGFLSPLISTTTSSPSNSFKTPLPAPCIGSWAIFKPLSFNRPMSIPSLKVSRYSDFKSAIRIRPSF